MHLTHPSSISLTFNVSRTDARTDLNLGRTCQPRNLGVQTIHESLREGRSSRDDDVGEEDGVKVGVDLYERVMDESVQRLEGRVRVGRDRRGGSGEGSRRELHASVSFTYERSWGKTYLGREETTGVEHDLGSAHAESSKVRVVAIWELERTSRLGCGVSRDPLSAVLNAVERRDARIVPSRTEDFARRLFKLVHHAELLRTVIRRRRGAVGVVRVGHSLVPAFIPSARGNHEGYRL